MEKQETFFVQNEFQEAEINNDHEIKRLKAKIGREGIYKREYDLLLAMIKNRIGEIIANSSK